MDESVLWQRSVEFWQDYVNGVLLNLQVNFDLYAAQCLLNASEQLSQQILVLVPLRVPPTTPTTPGIFPVTPGAFPVTQGPFGNTPGPGAFSNMQGAFSNTPASSLQAAVGASDAPQTHCYTNTQVYAQTHLAHMTSLAEELTTQCNTLLTKYAQGAQRAGGGGALSGAMGGGAALVFDSYRTIDRFLAQLIDNSQQTVLIR